MKMSPPLVNVSLAPSGDQEGDTSLVPVGAVVSLVGLVPSAFITKIPPVPTPLTNAILVPSGDQAG